MTFRDGEHRVSNTDTHKRAGSAESDDTVIRRVASATAVSAVKSQCTVVTRHDTSRCAFVEISNRTNAADSNTTAAAVAATHMSCSVRNPMDNEANVAAAYHLNDCTAPVMSATSLIARRRYFNRAPCPPGTVRLSCSPTDCTTATGQPRRRRRVHCAKTFSDCRFTNGTGYLTYRRT